MGVPRKLNFQIYIVKTEKLESGTFSFERLARFSIKNGDVKSPGSEGTIIGGQTRFMAYGGSQEIKFPSLHRLNGEIRVENLHLRKVGSLFRGKGGGKITGTGRGHYRDGIFESLESERLMNLEQWETPA